MDDSIVDTFTPLTPYYFNLISFAFVKEEGGGLVNDIGVVETGVLFYTQIMCQLILTRIVGVVIASDLSWSEHIDTGIIKVEKSISFNFLNVRLFESQGFLCAI